VAYGLGRVREKGYEMTWESDERQSATTTVAAMRMTQLSQRFHRSCNMNTPLFSLVIATLFVSGCQNQRASKSVTIITSFDISDTERVTMDVGRSSEESEINKRLQAKTIVLGNDNNGSIVYDNETDKTITVRYNYANKRITVLVQSVEK
jgi:hypothetical protein